MNLNEERAGLEVRIRAGEEALIAALEALKRHEQRLHDHDGRLQGTAQTIAALDANERLLGEVMNRLLVPFVAGGEVLPPVGLPIDFWDEQLAADNPYYTEPDVLERLRCDRLPLPGPENNENYTVPGSAISLLRYWLGGLDDYRRVVGACRDRGFEPRRIFDFGGSTGRLARHFAAQDGGREIWWCDFKSAAIEWCQRYFPADLKFFLNGISPHLPIEDGFFDVVTAFSVFTHIDELETAWLLELRRILRPGGIAYLTIHDEEVWHYLADVPDGMLTQSIRSTARGALADFTAPIDREVFVWTNRSYYKSNVFHSKSYIRRNWGRFFDIAAIVPWGHVKNQAVVIAVKPSRDTGGNG